MCPRLRYRKCTRRLRGSSSSSMVSFYPSASCEVPCCIWDWAWWALTGVCSVSVLFGWLDSGRAGSACRTQPLSSRRAQGLPFVAVTSLAVDRGRWTTWLVVAVLGLRLPEARGVFPNQRLSPCPLPEQEGSQPLNHQGNQRGTYLNAVFKISSERLGRWRLYNTVFSAWLPCKKCCLGPKFLNLSAIVA